MKNILSQLDINKINYGACSGSGKWSDSGKGGLIHSINPADGKEISSVYQSTKNDYDEVVEESIIAFEKFRKIPAEVRGQLVR